MEGVGKTCSSEILQITKQTLDLKLQKEVHLEQIRLLE